MYHDDISVVGGGWSFVGEGWIGRKLPGLVIGVNDAALLVPGGVGIAVSMDRLWSEDRWPNLVARAGDTWLRASAVQNIAERPPWLRVFQNSVTDARFSTDPAFLNGANSGYCALNLAYLLQPKRVFLFGFDMQKGPGGEPYWYPPYPWIKAGGSTSDGKYRDWVEDFREARAAFREAGITVVNCSARSRITFFEKARPQDLVRT